MAQIFHRSTNVLAYLSLAVAAATPVALILGGSAISRSPYNTSVGIAKEQPVPFSHEHHAVELGIDCRYCHGNVEKSATAGVPPTQTCMSCHSQIWTNSPLLEPVRASYIHREPIKWNQLNSVPDFVFFNHSIHIDRGINCNTCHGPIQKELIAYKGKPFFMAWCLNCHRTPENYVGKPKDEAPRDAQHPFANPISNDPVFGPYWKYQTYQDTRPEEERDKPEAKKERPSIWQLTAEEHTLMEGHEYERPPQALNEGKARLEKYRVKTEQLTDCSTCHH